MAPRIFVRTSAQPARRRPNASRREAYGAAKAWINAWTRGLAEEGRSCGIRVFAIAPGAVETRMLRDPFPDFPKRDTLNPDHVADVVHAVTEEACRYATGQTIFVRRQGD